MADIMLAKPAAGTQSIIQSVEDARIQLDFASADALLERSGNDPALSFRIFIRPTPRTPCPTS